MASVYVTFGDAVREHPVMRGRVGRTQVLDIEESTGEEESTLDANPGENIVSVYAQGDCWVAVGSAPNATTNPRHPVFAGERRDFWIESDEKVAIVAL